MKKIYTPLLALFLFISGCNDSNNQASTSGNFTTKAELLSSQNESDIRADLSLINPILNSANSTAMTTRSLLSEASRTGNKKEVKSLLLKSKTTLEALNNQLIALDIKSQEIQKVRTNIVNGNMITIKLYNLIIKDKRTPEEITEMGLLNRQSIALQKSVGEELDRLNAKYKKD